MSRIECTECHDLIDTTARTVVLPFVCDECRKAPELLAAMAPLQIEDADNHACDSATIENTTLLIEDLQNQLEMSKLEVNGLRLVYNDAQDTVERLRRNVENLLVKNFLKDEEIENLKTIGSNAGRRANELYAQNEKLSQETFSAYFESFLLKITNSKMSGIIKQLREELSYAATRVFTLAAETGRLEHERDVWQKRALIAKRCYDRASADRRYYRGKLKDAGIKA